MCYIKFKKFTTIFISMDANFFLVTMNSTSSIDQGEETERFCHWKGRRISRTEKLANQKSELT